MAKLWRRPNDTEPQSPSAVEVDLPNLRITKPSIVFLNGFFVMDSCTSWIPASLKAMEDLMANRAEGAPPVDVYSWTHSGLKDVFNVAAYMARPGSRCCAAVQRLTAGLVMPLVAKDFKIDEKGNISGAPLPPEEARRNLRNLTFFGYSAGCITAQECFNASMKMMKAVGYTEKDARETLHEVVFIGVGGPSRPNREKDRFTTLFLEATNDKIVRLKNRLWAPLRAFFSRFAHKLKIKPMGAHAAMISAAVPKKNWEFKLRDGKPVKEKVRNLLPSSLAVIRTYHELPRYVTQDEELSPFAKIVQYGLTNAVARKELMEPMALLEPPQGTEAPVAAAYRDKVSNAYVRPQLPV